MCHIQSLDTFSDRKVLTRLKPEQKAGGVGDCYKGMHVNRSPLGTAGQNVLWAHRKTNDRLAKQNKNWVKY